MYEAKRSMTPVGARFRMPFSIIGPISAPKPPIKANTIGTRMRASNAESRSVMINVMKTRTMT